MATNPNHFDARSFNSFRGTSLAILPLTLLLGLFLSNECNAQTPVRIPLPTERLLEAKPSKSISELVRQVSASDDETSDKTETRSDTLELGDDEPTDSLKEESTSDPASNDSGSTDAGSTDAGSTDAGSTDATANSDKKSDQSLRAQATSKHLGLLRKPISEINLRHGSEGRPVPENKAEALVTNGTPFTIGAMGYPVPPPDRYTTCQTHRPLYFEQPNLERCGNGCGVFQNAVSGATFLANTIALPYKVGKQRPDCEVPSGGDCKTCQSYPLGLDLVPVDKRGVMMELAAIAGFSFLLL